MSTASIAGVVIYVIVIALSAWAAQTALGRRQNFAERRSWVLVAASFLGLALLRLVNAEELLRQSLRQTIIDQGVYANRWDVQRPLVAVSMALAAVLFVWIVRRLSVPIGDRLDLPVRVALLAVLGFVPLLALRVISLHGTDMILYHGPLRLNWVLDAGLSLTVAASALIYIWASHHPGWRRPSKRN